MPIKYIGRTTSFKGKPLWEILGNLKNFGVGRIVVRSTFERYPEPSYMKICKVEAMANEDPRKVRVVTEKVFRGRKYPELVPLSSSSYKADFRLLHKDEEEAYCKTNSLVTLEKVKILPSTLPFPPLLREIVIAERRARGEDVTKEPEMDAIYNESLEGLSRKARENEEPNVKFEPGIGITLSPELYANVQRG